MSRAKIFLSYTLRDKELAAAIEASLRKFGILNVRPAARASAGANWGKVTTDAIRKADTVVVLASSPEAVRSSWVGFEVGAADALDKPSILLKPNTWSVQDFPENLRGLRIIDLDPQSPEATARMLAANLPVAA